MGISFTLPGQVRLIAVRFRDDAGSARLALFAIEIEIVEGRASDAGKMERTAFALVIEESAAELTDPKDVAFFELLCLADPKPAKIAGDLPVLGMT